MKKLLFIALLFVTACKVKQLPPETIVEKEVVKTEYIEKLRYDTVFVDVPVECKERTTRDTSSTLETSIAKSIATWINGFLFHSLENKNVSISSIVPVKDTEKIKDSIRTVEVEKPYPVPAEFTKWQSFCMMLGLITFWVIIVAMAIIIGYFAGKKWLKRYLIK